MKFFASLLAALFLALAAQGAAAQEYTAGSIKVSGVWLREPPDGAAVAGGYMSITNTGTAPDTLLGASIPGTGTVEVHEMKMVDGVMQMRQLRPGLVVNPGETVALKPGSFHLMLMDIKQRPKAGTPVKGTLTFEKAGAIAVEFKVEPVGSRGPAQSGGHKQH